LPESFPVKTVITKFGSIPDFYNHLTWITAHLFPEQWVASPKGLEFFSRISYLMTHLTDRLSGIGVAIRADITGKKNGKLAIYQAKMVHPHTAIAAGCGAGTVAQLLLSKDLNRSGLFPVEQILSTELFTQVMAQRNIKIEQQLSFRSS
jgi:saccharopine dehydrogenase-like NADP-dependent oxidoreductase